MVAGLPAGSKQGWGLLLRACMCLAQLMLVRLDGRHMDEQSTLLSGRWPQQAQCQDECSRSAACCSRALGTQCLLMVVDSRVSLTGPQCMHVEACCFFRLVLCEHFSCHSLGG